MPQGYGSGYGAGAAAGLTEVLADLRLKQLDKQAALERAATFTENQRRYELAQARLAEQDKIAADTRQSTAARLKQQDDIATAARERDIADRQQLESLTDQMSQAEAAGDQNMARAIGRKVFAITGRMLPDAQTAKRDIRSVDGALVDVTGGRPTVIYTAPAKPPSESAQLANTLRQLQIDERTEKMQDSQKAAAQREADARTTTKSALDSVNALLVHPGIGAATGAYELRGFTQPAQDFNAERDRLVASLTLPNLGALKGPMSDKDVVFVKQLATKLANTKMSAEATRAELNNLKTFLQGKLTSQGGEPADAGAIEQWVRDPQTGKLRKK